MGLPPLATKLRCASWEQLAALYEREIKASRLFLRAATAAAAPPAGTEISIDLTLPSGTIIPLSGRVARLLTEGPRAPGVELVLTRVPPSTLWLIESALQAAQRRSGSATAITVLPPPPRDVEQPFADDITFVGDEEGGDEVSIEIIDEPEAAAAQQALVSTLEVELAGMRALNPFQILGVSYVPSDDEVRTAWNEVSKRTHPDRYARFESERARALATEMFVVARDAYTKLADPAGRAALAAKLRPRGGTPTPSAPVSPGPDGSKPIARVPLVPGRAAPPPPPLPAAPKLSADDLFADLGGAPAADRGAVPVAIEPEPSSVYAEADRLLSAGQYDRALAGYQETLQRKPGDRRARIGRELALGLRLVAAGDRTQAAQHFEAVLELDPLHEAASRELAAIRRAASESRKGVLSKLLGRKS